REHPLPLRSMSSDIALSGLSITGFRSFASDPPERLAPMGKVHLLAGPNNSGKSNVLRVVQRVLPAIANRVAFEMEPTDRPWNMADAPLHVGLAFDLAGADIGEVIGAPQHSGDLTAILAEGNVLDAAGTLWLEYEARFAGNKRAEWILSPRQ